LISSSSPVTKFTGSPEKEDMMREEHQEMYLLDPRKDTIQEALLLQELCNSAHQLQYSGRSKLLKYGASVAHHSHQQQLISTAQYLQICTIKVICMDTLKCPAP
jgi:hypothetical protein